MKKSIIFSFVFAMFLFACSKDTAVIEEAPLDVSSKEQFIEWAGDRLVPTESDIPGTDAYLYYPSPDSEPQTILFPNNDILFQNNEKGGFKDFLLVGGGCDKKFTSDIHNGNIYMLCAGAGTKCRTIVGPDGNVCIIVCGAAE